MSIESVLASEIAKVVAVTALVGDRIWPVAAPQTSGKPFITYRRVASGELLYTQSGQTSVQKVYFQIASVAETYEQVIDLAQKVCAGLSGKRGLGDGSITMNGIFFREPEDTWNQETGLFVRTQECAIMSSTS